jgi:hypothetical protein
MSVENQTSQRRNGGPVSLFGFVALLALIGGAIWLLSDELNVQALAGATGSTRSDAKFGIRIGAHAPEAAARLRAGGLVEIPDSAPDEPCLFGTARAGETDRVFLDRGWRRASICLSIRDDRVTQISWYFSPLAP